MDCVNLMMEIANLKPTIHPQFLEILFGLKSKSLPVFADVLGLLEVHHISLTYLTKKHQLFSISSTPALEFNLFRGGDLWQYDRTYHLNWIQQLSISSWEYLYHPAYYTELYYLKQIKHKYRKGISFVEKINDNYIVYSFASQNDSLVSWDLPTTEYQNFHKIGRYCQQNLQSLLCDFLT